MKKSIKAVLLCALLLVVAAALFGCSKNGTYSVSKITRTDNLETLVLELNNYDEMAASEKLLADIYKDRLIEIKGNNIKFLCKCNDANAKAYNFKIKNKDLIFDDPVMNSAGIKCTFSNGKFYLTFNQLNCLYEIEFKKS